MATGGRQKPVEVCPQKADAPWCPLFRPEEADVQTTLSVKDALAVTGWFAGDVKRSWRSGRTFAWDFSSRSNPPCFFVHVQRCGKENEANYLPPRLILGLTIGIIESWRVIPFGLQMFPGSVVLLRGTWRAKKYPSCDWLCVKVAPSGDGSKTYDYIILHSIVYHHIWGNNH